MIIIVLFLFCFYLIVPEPFYWFYFRQINPSKVEKVRILKKIFPYYETAHQMNSIFFEGVGKGY